MAILLTESSLNSILENSIISEMCNLDYLEEAYYGEKPVQKAFWAFSNFRDKYVGKPVSQIVNAASDPDMLKFNREIESAFGFYRFSLDITATPLQNAYTFPVGGRPNTGSAKEQIRVRKSGGGVIFDSSSKMIGLTIITWPLLSDPNYTNREVFAILLHEIGHNFSTGLLEGGGVMEKIRLSSYNFQKIYGPIMGLLHGGVYNAATDNIRAEKYVETKQKLIENHKSIYQAMVITRQFIVPIIRMIIMYSSYLNYIRTRLAARLLMGGSGFASARPSVGNDINKSVENYGYRDEKMSDTFASMYGFGVDITSALQKLTLQRGLGSNNVINKVSIAGTLVDLLNLPFQVIVGLIDEHPDVLARAKTQMDYIENELKNNKSVDPLMRKELQDQFNAVKSSIEDFINIKDHKDGTSIIRSYNKMLYEQYGGAFREYKSDNQKIMDYTNDLIDKMKKA